MERIPAGSFEDETDHVVRARDVAVLDKVFSDSPWYSSRRMVHLGGNTVERWDFGHIDFMRCPQSVGVDSWSSG